MKRIISVLLLAALVAGCAAQREFVKTYDGPALPFDQSALLKPSLEVEIHAIDGDASKRFRANRWTVVDADISFAPGAHQISVGYSRITPTGSISSVHDQVVSFNAVEGHKYILDAKETGNSWAAQLIDVTDKPALWCMWQNNACMNNAISRGPSKPIPPDQIK